MNGPSRARWCRRYCGVFLTANLNKSNFMRCWRFLFEVKVWRRVRFEFISIHHKPKRNDYLAEWVISYTAVSAHDETDTIAWCSDLLCLFNGTNRRFAREPVPSADSTLVDRHVIRKTSVLCVSKVYVMATIRMFLQLNHRIPQECNGLRFIRLDWSKRCCSRSTWDNLWIIDSDWVIT